MTADTSLARIDRYWATFFGCTREELSSSGTITLPHAALEGYPGILLFRRGTGCIISVPEPLRERLTERLSLPPDEIFDASRLTAILRGAVQQIIGPAWIGYVDEHSFKPTDDRGSRLLTADDDPVLRILAGSASRTEWEQSGIEFGQEPMMGAFAGARLVAAGRLEPRDEHILDLGLITARAERGKGYGKAVAGALSAWGIERGSIVQYRTLLANGPAMAIARSLGYRGYAETIAVHLARAETNVSWQSQH